MIAPRLRRRRAFSLIWFRRSVRLFGVLGLGSVFNQARAFPELAGRLHRFNAGFLPPGRFIANAMHQPMMDATETLNSLTLRPSARDCAKRM
jgi:hypothetical protein